jgi:hypothetical protein
MSILLYVVTMIMLLAILTYGRLDMYRSEEILRQYMQKAERIDPLEAFNDSQDRLYNETHVSSKENGNGNGKNNTSQSTGKLSIATMLHNKEKEEVQQFQKRMLKEMMIYFYDHDSYFQDLTHERPQLYEEIIDRIIESVKEKKEENQALKKIQELANLDLKDPQLNMAYYKMLIGGGTNPEKISSKEDQEQKINEGYPSLLDYLTLKGNGKIRLWLAPKPILILLFGEVSTAEEAIQFRRELYKDVEQERIEKNSAEEIFIGAFQSRIRSDLPSDMIDFSVSKSNPKRAHNETKNL